MRINDLPHSITKTEATDKLKNGEKFFYNLLFSCPMNSKISFANASSSNVPMWPLPSYNFRLDPFTRLAISSMYSRGKYTSAVPPIIRIGT
jgi:hypothetical protein